MPIYRHDRLPGGSDYVRRTTWEDEAAGAVVGGAFSAAGWLIGSGISGLRTLAHTSQDRRLVRAATALEQASESEDVDRFLALAEDFVSRYYQLADGQRHSRKRSRERDNSTPPSILSIERFSGA